MTKLAPALWGIPTVNSSTDRDLLFPSPAVGQKVENLGTGARERWTGSAWTAVASAGTASVNDTRSTPIAMVQQLNASGYAIFGIDRASTARVSALRYSLSNADEWFVGMLYNGGSASTSMAWSPNNALASAVMTLTNSGSLALGGGVQVQGDSGVAGSINKTGVLGLLVRLVAGSAQDFSVYDPSGVLAFWMPTGSRTVLFEGGIRITGGGFSAGGFYKDANYGLSMGLIAGATYDFSLFTPSGGAAILRVPTGTSNVEVANGTLKVALGFGCNGITPQSAYASGGALAAYGAGANGFDTAGHASALYALVVAIRGALVANGIMS